MEEYSEYPGSEADTFRKLKQTPFNEIRRIMMLQGLTLNVDVLAQHGWTLKEYNEARTEYFDARANTNDYFGS